MKKMMLFCGLILGLLGPYDLQAKLITILHTNDLHSYLESTIEDPSKGGYAYLKTILEEEKAKSEKLGIPTLIFDAGDFLEGNLFFMSNGGKQVMKVMNHMGYDAVVLGNHDWLMGTAQMEKYLKDTPPTFPLLAANFKVKKGFSVLNKTLLPYKNFDIEGLKVSVLGLTTNELFYRWAHDQGKIDSPLRSGRYWARRLRKQGADVIIALTHLGVEIDKALARHADLDLIVGGHSHTALHEAQFVGKKNGRNVPVVQAGSHGQYLGKLVIDVEKGKPLKVKEYKLIPIDQKSIIPHEGIKKIVEESKEKLGKEYGHDWLYGEVAWSELSLESSGQYLTPWSAFLVDVSKEKIKADVGIDSPSFFGKVLPKGPVSRATLFNAYPRIFGLENRKGWRIWSADVKGSVLKRFAKIVVASRLPMIFSGLEFDLVDKNDKRLTPHDVVRILDELNWGKKIKPTYQNFIMHGIDKTFKLKNFKVNGKEVVRRKLYKVALSEGFAKGGLGISRAVRLLLKNLAPTPYTMWDSLTERFQDLGVMTGQYIKRHYYGFRPIHEQRDEMKRPHLFIPKSNLK
jgi:2',3'-cyclic-nucleotide 2'-phosphodiesterase (5'-nucleotidase family)